ncbi:hypothetical protein EOL96_01190 [Candidatus Saccharibacteria bacterium]|nr:hypothetical protein [Candidatus Saccharibacteria bacterium]
MQVQLTLKDEFITALRNYAPSDDTLRTLAEMPLVIMLSITAGGRNTIINELVKTGRYHYIVSDTTRPPKVRNGALEEDGVVYHFRSEEEVLRDVKQGRYLEAELIHNQQVSGMGIRELIRAHASNKTPISEVDLGGADAITHVKTDTLCVFVIPPSYDEWMRRLTAREDMGSQELENRLRTAIRVLKKALVSNHFVFVVNDDLDEVVRTVDDYIAGERHDLHDESARKVAGDIYEKILTHYPGLNKPLAL